MRCFKERLLFDKDELLIWSLQGKSCSKRTPCIEHKTGRTEKVSTVWYRWQVRLNPSFRSSRYLISHANHVKFNCCFRLGIHFTLLYSWGYFLSKNFSCVCVLNIKLIHHRRVVLVLDLIYI